MDKSIVFKNVRKIKKITEDKKISELEVLKLISFIVERGETISIIGPSGSGKSTILRLINRLEDVDDGEILINSENIKNKDILKLRKNIGFVFQLPYLFDGSVFDNITWSNQLLDDASVDDKWLDDLLDYVQIERSWLNRKHSNLSVGQKQRVSLARALWSKPEILLMDETTASLDNSTSEKIFRAIEKLREKLDLTIVYVTHEKEKILYSDRVLFIYDGKVLEEGTPDRILNRPSSEITKKFLQGEL